MTEGELFQAVIIVVVVILIVYFISKTATTSHMVSGNEFPGQLVATAAMQEEIASGYNQPYNPAATDPYFGAMIDVASQENAWNTSDWSAVY